MLHLLQPLLCFMIQYMLLIFQIKVLMLSCDTTPCKGGHLEKKKKVKERNNYIIFPMNNSVSATCH